MHKKLNFIIWKFVTPNLLVQQKFLLITSAIHCCTNFTEVSNVNLVHFHVVTNIGTFSIQRISNRLDQRVHCCRCCWYGALKCIVSNTSTFSIQTISYELDQGSFRVMRHERGCDTHNHHVWEVVTGKIEVYCVLVGS